MVQLYIMQCVIAWSQETSTNQTIWQQGQPVCKTLHAHKGFIQQSWAGSWQQGASCQLDAYLHNQGLGDQLSPQKTQPAVLSFEGSQQHVRGQATLKHGRAGHDHTGPDDVQVLGGLQMSDVLEHEGVGGLHSNSTWCCQTHISFLPDDARCLR